MGIYFLLIIASEYYVKNEDGAPRACPRFLLLRLFDATSAVATFGMASYEANPRVCPGHYAKADKPRHGSKTMCAREDVKA